MSGGNFSFLSGSCVRPEAAFHVWFSSHVLGCEELALGLCTLRRGSLCLPYVLLIWPRIFSAWKFFRPG